MRVLIFMWVVWHSVLFGSLFLRGGSFVSWVWLGWLGSFGFVRGSLVKHLGSLVLFRGQLLEIVHYLAELLGVFFCGCDHCELQVVLDLHCFEFGCSRYHGVLIRSQEYLELLSRLFEFGWFGHAMSTPLRG